MNLPVRPVTALANSASAAPFRPAGYAGRYRAVNEIPMLKIFAAILGGFLVAGTALSFDSAERRVDTDEDVKSRPTLTDVSAILKRRVAGELVKSVGPIGLGGFNYFRTVELGNGRSLVAISCNLGGGLLAFAGSGSFIAARRTWEQASLQLVDLDGDGQDEVITLEKDVVGTGILGWNYHVYRLAANRWLVLWSGVSYEWVMVGSTPEVHEGLLRVADSGTDHVRLMYVERSSPSLNWSVSEWVLDGGKFRRNPAR